MVKLQKKKPVVVCKTSKTEQCTCSAPCLPSPRPSTPPEFPPNVHLKGAAWDLVNPPMPPAQTSEQKRLSTQQGTTTQQQQTTAKRFSFSKAKAGPRMPLQAVENEFADWDTTSSRLPQECPEDKDPPCVHPPPRSLKDGQEKGPRPGLRNDPEITTRRLTPSEDRASIQRLKSIYESMNAGEQSEERGRQLERD